MPKVKAPKGAPSAASSSSSAVAICICTCRRPAGLRRLLMSIAKLNLTGLDDVQVGVVIVDNDGTGEAEEVFKECEPLLPQVSDWQTFVCEPQRGISFARNRAIETAAPRADFVAFVDDDEEVDEHWLAELVAVQRSENADVVAGPVLPRYEVTPPEWIVRGRFFDRTRVQNGTPIPYFGTCNVFLRLAALEGVRFEPRLALAGGEDTLLSMQLVALGRTMVWANDAVAHEWNPESRLSAHWILRRKYRLGTSIAFSEYVVRGTGVNPLRLIKGLASVASGLITLPFTVLSGRAGTVWSLGKAYRGAGMIAGMFGSLYKEYEGA